MVTTKSDFMRNEAFLNAKVIFSVSSILFQYMADVHKEGGGKLQYSYSFLRKNGRYTTPKTALCCCYGPPRGLPATLELIHKFIIGRIRWRRGARACSTWVRPWRHPERRRQFRIYDQLMVELRREDPRTFKKFHYGRSFEI